MMKNYTTFFIKKKVDGKISSAKLKLVQKEKNTKIIIGLVGEKGSGKETFTNLLEEIAAKDTRFHNKQTVARYRFSDILGETLAAWGIPKNRHNYQLLPQIFRGAAWTGMTPEEKLRILSNTVKRRAIESPANITVLDGVRWLEDAAMLREIPGSLLVYITANADIRYMRLKARSEKAGELGMTREQFDREEQAENEIYIPKIGGTAEWTIYNEGATEWLKGEADRFLEYLLNPRRYSAKARE